MITKTKQSIYIETYGCEKNQADTTIIRADLAKDGFEFVTDEFTADVILLVTCEIRENATRELSRRVYQIRIKSKKEGKPVIIGILGCMADTLRQELFKHESLHIDFIAGPEKYKRLGDLVRQSVLRKSHPTAKGE